MLDYSTRSHRGVRTPAGYRFGRFGTSSLAVRPSELVENNLSSSNFKRDLPQTGNLKQNPIVITSSAATLILPSHNPSVKFRLLFFLSTHLFYPSHKPSNMHGNKVKSLLGLIDYCGTTVPVVMVMIPI